MSESRPAAAANRRPLILLLLIFGAPLALAFWLYYGSDWRPSMRTNHGELIEPVVALPDLALPLAGSGEAPDLFRGKWSLVVIGEGPEGCGGQCRDTLVYARQTWLSLGQLAPRVQRVLFAGTGCCDADYLQREQAGLVVIDGTGAAARRLLQRFPAPRKRTIYVVDPQRNLMMRYDVRLDPKGLRVDLKKLLELSHIG